MPLVICSKCNRKVQFEMSYLRGVYRRNGDPVCDRCVVKHFTPDDDKGGKGCCR